MSKIITTDDAWTIIERLSKPITDCFGKVSKTYTCGRPSLVLDYVQDSGASTPEKIQEYRRNYNIQGFNKRLTIGQENNLVPDITMVTKGNDFVTPNMLLREYFSCNHNIDLEFQNEIFTVTPIQYGLIFCRPFEISDNAEFYKILKCIDNTAQCAALGTHVVPVEFRIAYWDHCGTYRIQEEKYGLIRPNGIENCIAHSKTDLAYAIGLITEYQDRHPQDRGDR